jgi:hypothetical protein
MTKHVIFNLNETDRIDFSLIEQDSVAALRISTDGLRSFISFEVLPSFLSDFTWISRIYEDGEMKAILQTHEWIVPIN